MSKCKKCKREMGYGAPIDTCALCEYEQKKNCRAFLEALYPDRSEEQYREGVRIMQHVLNRG